MSILSKRVVDLTEEDKKGAGKPLGTARRPFPMRYAEQTVDAQGRKAYMQRLGALRNDAAPLMVYSDRSYAEVIGMMLREMPTPGMLPMLADALSQRRPGNKRVLQYFEGAPGTGKTFMSEMIARARSKQGAIKIDCGKKNLGELLFETVLDFGKDRRFYDEFDKRLQHYNEADSDEARARIFHPHSVAILRSHLGDALVEENGKLAIDWGRTHEGPVDADGNRLDSREAVKVVNDGLIAVAQKEGFGHMAGNALGMATQEGPLIRAWKEGRELVLDEFNRGKEGTTASLHTVLQFLAGEIDQVTVENTLKEKGEEIGQTFTFRREDQKLGFFVTATGNSEEDGSDVNELAGSVSSRIVPKFIPVATEEDWQHRICQIMTGLPVSTLYRASEEDWRKNPDGFRQKLLEWRTLGLSKEQAANVPAMQMKLLQRWEDVVEATEKLAKFYYSWSQVVNPDSPLHSTGSLAQLMEEIDERYNSKIGVDFRKIILHINEALEQRPVATGAEMSQGVDLDDWSTEPVVTEGVEEDVSLHFGSRLVNVILNHLNATTIELGKRKLHQQLMKLAEDCGLAMPGLHEGRANNRRNVGALLDDNPYASDVPDIKAELLRNMLCDYLREKDARLTADNNDIMSVRNVRAAIEAMESLASVSVPDIGEEHEDAPDEDDVAPLAVFNDDLETLQKAPLLAAGAVDSVPDKDGKAAATPKVAALLPQEQLLYSIAVPALRKGNLRAIWSRALSRSGLVVPAAETGLGDSVAIAENRSQSGLAVTTVVVSNDNGKKARAVPLHIIWNETQERMMIVGEGKLPQKVATAFGHTRVQYIDRTDSDAAHKATGALALVAGGNDEKVRERLKTAFLMRNMLDDLAEQEKTSLPDLLVRADVKCFLPRFLVKPARANGLG